MADDFLTDAGTGAALREAEERIAKLEGAVEELRGAMAELRACVPPSEFEQLRRLLESDRWPAAVDPSLMCDIDSEQDKQDRAEGILDLIMDIYLENLAFLDFGCGEGHTVNRAMSQKPRKAVGYDIRNPGWDRWPKKDNMLFTSDWAEVVKNGPYQAILLYDVVDHLEGGHEPMDSLRNVRQVTAPNAQIYIRCHPWCSRHGTHHYVKKNKAYMHLVFKEDELERMGLGKGYACHKVTHPLDTYRSWLRGAGFQIRKEQITRQPVENFFSDHPIVSKYIKENWSGSPYAELRSGAGFPRHQMEQQFVDYIVS